MGRGPILNLFADLQEVVHHSSGDGVPNPIGPRRSLNLEHPHEACKSADGFFAFWLEAPGTQVKQDRTGSREDKTGHSHIGETREAAGCGDRIQNYCQVAEKLKRSSGVWAFKNSSAKKTLSWIIVGMELSALQRNPETHLTLREPCQIVAAATSLYTRER